MSKIASLDWRVRPAPSTRSVTRVESLTKQTLPEITTCESRTRIDWLNCTFDGCGLKPQWFKDEIQQFFRVSLIGEHRVGEGFLGFAEAWKLMAKLADGSAVQVGVIALGGQSQRGRWLFQVNGRGCGLVNNWQGLSGFLSTLADLTLSRVDIAADFLNGEYTVDDALTLYSDGEFISRGRNPQLDIQGDWFDKGEGKNRGRTVYIGKFKNGKALCVYEKGKQLNMEGEGENWVRYEVRLGNRDREIPLEVLTNPDKFFRGAYPAIAHMLDGAAEEIPTIAKEAKASLAHGLFHASRCYGKYFHQALQATDCEFSDLVEEVRIIGLPSKIDPIGVIHGVPWNELKAQINEYRIRA